MQIHLLLQISLKEESYFCHVKHSANNINYMSVGDPFRLLTYSDLCSLFQHIIMLVHFVFTVFVKNLQGKYLFVSQLKKKKPLCVTMTHTVNTVHNSLFRGSQCLLLDF